MTLKIDNKTADRVFELTCECGVVGGTITFPAFHGRDSDEALEAELKAQYSHVCDDCCCKDTICDKHAKRDSENRIIEPIGPTTRTSIHPDPKYHHHLKYDERGLPKKV